MHEKILNTNNRQITIKQKSKWDITSYQLRWPLLKEREISKDVGKRKLLDIVGRNVNWYSHYRKHYGASSKSWKYNNSMNQQPHSWIYRICFCPRWWWKSTSKTFWIQILLAIMAQCLPYGFHCGYNVLLHDILCLVLVKGKNKASDPKLHISQNTNLVITMTRNIF